VKKGNEDQLSKKEIEFFGNQLSDFLELRKKIKPKQAAFKIICIYLIFGVLWISLSDMVLEFLIKDIDTFKKVEVYKGWAYVIITGIIFYYVISRRMVLFRIAINKMFEGYEELTAAHEELVALEEELSHNFDELEKHRDALMVSNQRYSLAVEGCNDGIWDWDLLNNVYFFSLKWKEAFGYREDELGDTFEAWKQLLHPEDKQRSVDTIYTYLESKKGIYENTYRIRTKSGTYRWILSRGKGIWDSEGNAIRLSGSHTDITEYIELQESLRKEKELSEKIIKNAQMGIIVVNNEGKITKFNPFAEIISGYKEKEVLGKNVFKVFLSESKIEPIRKLFDRVILGESFGSVEIDVICKDKRDATILINYSLLHDNIGNTQGLLATGIDITDRINLEKKLHSLAYHDIVTQLPNRTMLEEEVNKLIIKAKSAKTKLAFIYIDLDNFKHINDNFGHSAGDKLLVHIANKLSHHITYPDLVARLGGDEFAIVLNIKDTNEAIQKVNDILKHLKTPWEQDHQSFFISASMGVAIYPDHGENISALMQNADTAMFNIKDRGKAGYSIFVPEMREKAFRYVELSNQLRAAIENEEFLLYYQPQIDLKTNKIVGVEALIRWIHPDEGFISPREFIPFAEETGYINQIGEWVLRTAFKQKKAWEEKGYDDIKMAVNISSKTLASDEVTSQILNILNEYDVNHSSVELEITETAIMGDLERVISTLQIFKESNITIALDDFGTGYSSLTYLKKLPIDILKADREFIKNIADENDEAYILNKTIELAHNLGLKVVAEGVETKGQLAYLRKNNCDIAQGYYFSKPVPASEIETLLKNNREFEGVVIE